MPKVSIVLPVYNGEKYIRESVDSVLNQTFKDFELIIVNDCSTDDTSNIINEYAKKDNRIKIINNEKNQKLPKSLNIGFKHSKGKYLTWTSDDNIYMPTAIKKMYDYLSQDDEAAMVCADNMMIDENGDDLGIFRTYSIDLCYTNCVGACFLYKREILDIIGEYDATLFLVEDYDYWLRIEEKYGEIHHIDEVLYKYRRHSDSLSGKKLLQVKKSEYILKDKYKDYILKKFGNNYDLLCKIFCKACLDGYSKTKLNKGIVKLYPQLMPLIKQTKKYKDVVIFGAGYYGKLCAKKIDKNILFFVDNNINIVGSIVENYEVKSVDEIHKLNKNVCVVVGVSLEKKPQIIRQLYEMNYENIDIII